MKSGSLNLLERWGPVKGRTGIALPLPSTFHIYVYELNPLKSDLYDVIEDMQVSWKSVQLKAVLKIVNKNFPVFSTFFVRFP
jgi:hypothetical protein